MIETAESRFVRGQQQENSIGLIETAESMSLGGQLRENSMGFIGGIVRGARGIARGALGVVGGALGGSRIEKPKPVVTGCVSDQKPTRPPNRINEFGRYWTEVADGINAVDSSEGAKNVWVLDTNDRPMYMGEYENLPEAVDAPELKMITVSHDQPEGYGNPFGISDEGQIWYFGDPAQVQGRGALAFGNVPSEDDDSLDEDSDDDTEDVNCYANDDISNGNAIDSSGVGSNALNEWNRLGFFENSCEL